ncbi:ABC transporter permease [candidate division KSB1 bacterium]|nr:ABC transporter permease [candidate division KSB1 bacterium]
MNLFYSVREAFAGFTKARVSTVITIFTVSFFLFLLSIVAILSLNMNRVVTMLNANHDVQVFLSNTISAVEKDELRAEILDMDDVLAVDYISKDQAAAEFQREFGDDIFEALEENPLPASFIIKLNENSDAKTNINDFAQKLEQMPNIDEVVMHQGALQILVKFSSVSRVVMYVLFVLVFLGSLFMISNTIRLIIFARRKIIATMKLVGATDAFIRRPFLFEGILQGLVGGSITMAAIYLLVKIFVLQWPGLLVVSKEFYLIVLLAGMLFGFIGSLFAIRRFL